MFGGGSELGQTYTGLDVLVALVHVLVDILWWLVVR